jgi:hypothetical protein
VIGQRDEQTRFAGSRRDFIVVADGMGSFIGLSDEVPRTLAGHPRFIFLADRGGTTGARGERLLRGIPHRRARELLR